MKSRVPWSQRLICGDGFGRIRDSTHAYMLKTITLALWMKSACNTCFRMPMCVLLDCLQYKVRARLASGLSGMDSGICLSNSN